MDDSRATAPMSSTGAGEGRRRSRSPPKMQVPPVCPPDTRLRAGGPTPTPVSWQPAAEDGESWEHEQVPEDRSSDSDNIEIRELARQAREQRARQGGNRPTVASHLSEGVSGAGSDRGFAHEGRAGGGTGGGGRRGIQSVPGRHTPERGGGVVGRRGLMVHVLDLFYISGRAETRRAQLRRRIEALFGVVLLCSSLRDLPI